MTRQTLQQESYLVPEIFICECRAEQDLTAVIFLSIVQTQIHKYYLQIKNRIKEHSLCCLMSFFSACNSVGTGRSSVEKPPESQTTRQLAGSLIIAPNS
jgi:hypothetical protein